MFGGVGTGKTMLMDLLVHSAPPQFQVQIFSPSDRTLPLCKWGLGHRLEKPHVSFLDSLLCGPV